MKHLFFTLLLLSFSLVDAITQIVVTVPLSARLTGYKIDAVLDPDEKIVKGKMEAFWVNNSSDIVPDVRLHMYLNAFSSNKTTFFKESGGTPGSDRKDIGWIRICSLKESNGTNLVPLMKFISPDDGNPDDRTVLQVVLPKPALPGDTVFIVSEFESKLPSRMIRTGYADDFFFVGQWFPKFGVYESAGMRNRLTGGWNCHQFHANSEFYANHSVYDVNITVPTGFVVGSGGMTLSEKDNGDSTKTVTIRAEDIVDFAWTAWPGYNIYTDRWRNVNIILLCPPEKKGLVQRHLVAVKNALEYLDANVGPYPWPHLTFVDPPVKGMGAGGMEYTTLFTTASVPGLPEYMLSPESVTVHEFGHAYFMGILASNEFEEPWLDEGVNSYWEQRIMDHYYGNGAGVINHPLLKVSDRSTARSDYVTSPSKQAVTNAEYSWNYPHGTYTIMSYRKPAAVLHTLTGIIGEDTMNEVFREYYRKWAFKHPSGKDFIEVFNNTVPRLHGQKYGTDLNWFFNQTLYGTGICDYKVINIINRKISSLEGAASIYDSVEVVKNVTKDDSLYSSVVQLQRDGELMLPVEILVRFDNGEEVTEQWHGKTRVKDLKYTGTNKVEWVKIDPEYKNMMDINYINNSMTINADEKPVKILFNKLVSIMMLFLDFLFV
ncbi:MAG: M1 family metallopeptidase [Bacteroidales bacterium]|nr:M1 family metallopeptidase [Bacteroidales bacterium]